MKDNELHIPNAIQPGSTLNLSTPSVQSPIDYVPNLIDPDQNQPTRIPNAFTQTPINPPIYHPSPPKT